MNWFAAILIFLSSNSILGVNSDDTTTPEIPEQFKDLDKWMDHMNERKFHPRDDYHPIHQDIDITCVMCEYFDLRKKSVMFSLFCFLNIKTMLAPSSFANC